MLSSDPSIIECPSCGFGVPVAERCESCNSPLVAAPAKAIHPSPFSDWANFTKTLVSIAAEPVPTPPSPLAAVSSYPTPPAAMAPLPFPPVVGRAPPPPQSEYPIRIGGGSGNIDKLRYGIVQCLKATGTVSGRTSKEVFGAYAFAVILLLAALTFIAVTVQPVLYTTQFVNSGGFLMPISTFDSDAFTALLTAVAIPLVAALVPLTSAAIRRLHDIGKPGRLVGLAYVCHGIALVEAINGDVGVGFVVFMGTSAAAAYLLSRPGDPAPNRYGPAPSI